jgi:hypothetical protein
MVSRNRYPIGSLYYLAIFFMISSFNILPQDNTNNKMQDKAERDNLREMISQNANYYSSDLREKLNLTESQMKYIYYVLFDYYTKETGNQWTQRAALRENKESLNKETGVSNNKEDNLKGASLEASVKIENILDNGQRNRWREVNDSWWINVKTELYNGDQNLTTNSDIDKEKSKYEDDRDYEDYDVYYPGYDFK